MTEPKHTPAGQHRPIYWVLLVLGLACFGASWIGERQGLSSTLTLVLTLGGVALLVVDSLFFRHPTS